MNADETFALSHAKFKALASDCMSELVVKAATYEKPEATCFIRRGRKTLRAHTFTVPGYPNRDADPEGYEAWIRHMNVGEYRDAINDFAHDNDWQHNG